jgi:catechol-2,3-dioxygenase
MRLIGLTFTAVLMTVAGLEGQPAPNGAPEFAIVGPAFLALQVADVESAATWYSTVFSLSPVNEIDAADGRYRIRILTSPALTVELIESRGIARAPERHLGLFKFGFYVDDIEAAFHWFRSAGVETDNSTFVDSALSVRSFLMRDPEGNRLQVFARCGESC